MFFEYLSLWYFPKDDLSSTLQDRALYNKLKEIRISKSWHHEVMTKLTFLVRLKISNSSDSLRFFPLGILPQLDQDISHSLGRDRWWSDEQIMSSQSHTQFWFWFHALSNQSQVCGTIYDYILILLNCPFILHLVSRSKWLVIYGLSISTFLSLIPCFASFFHWPLLVSTAWAVTKSSKESICLAIETTTSWGRSDQLVMETLFLIVSHQSSIRQM